MATTTIDYQRQLNPGQLSVVMAGNGPLLVIAGAGSGKTRTLTYRVARLVESGVDPGRILLLTFTNKAAREMLRRVEELMGIHTGSLLGGTFHHVGNVLLRRYAEVLGRRPQFSIIDRDDSSDLIADLVASHREENPNFPKADILIELISYSVNTGTPLSRTISERNPAYLDFGREIMKAAEAYAMRKEELNLVDFDDLLVLWRELVRRHPPVRDELHRQFQHILVDEYQDTNRLQADIVEGIAGPDGNLMVVGDDAQSIYSFRGANFDNIIDFPTRFPTVQKFRLDANYRSTPEVLSLANESISHNERQFPKDLKAFRPAGRKPVRVVCGSLGDQARFIAERVAELNGEGVPLAEIAVLYRAHWHSMELQMELTRHSIPFQVRSGVRFFEQAHIKDVAAYLRIAINPKDELAWKRVLRLYPKVGKGTADKVWASISMASDPFAALASAPVPKSAKAGMGALAGSFALIRQETVTGDMIKRILKDGYEDYLTANFQNHSIRVEDLKRLADYAVRFTSVDEFLAELALAGNAAGADSMGDGSAGDSAIVLSTIHQAKGLEWQAVFILSLNDGRLPDARSMRDDNEDGIEEERRLFYVACTRAKDLLYLCTPTVANERGLPVVQRPSMFVAELNHGSYETIRI